jgi:hypothetical protein
VGLPPLKIVTAVSRGEIRELIILLFQVFGTLFADDLAGIGAANRFEAVVIRFLDRLHNIGQALHPDKKHPIWLSKYGILGLLRCRQHFVDYTRVHSLYEGGIVGEGMVKELRPLCPNAVRAGWPRNLMEAYNRQNMLHGLTMGFQKPLEMDTAPHVSRLDPNCKRYVSWQDVAHAMTSPTPISIVVIGTEHESTCYVVVHMFHQSYKKPLTFDHIESYVDEFGFVYHNLTVGTEETEWTKDDDVLTYGLLLPNIWDTEGLTQFCIVDKEWRFVNQAKQWTLFH